MEQVSIIIADDHPLLRQGLKQVLELEPAFKVIAEAVDGEDAVAKCCQYKPDVVVMDITMPKMNGLEAARQIKASSPQTGVVILTIHEGDEYLFQSIKAGVNGYVLKDSEPEVLIDAVKAAQAGKAYLDPGGTKRLMGEFNRLMNQAPGPAEKDILSDREIEIIRLVAQGKSNKEIGEELFISEKTVKNHISNIFKKIGVTDRTEAAVYAVKQGWYIPE